MTNKTKVYDYHAAYDTLQVTRVTFQDTIFYKMCACGYKYIIYPFYS